MKKQPYKTFCPPWQNYKAKKTDRSYIAIGDSAYQQNEVQVEQQQRKLFPKIISVLGCMLSPELLSVCIIFQIEINGI